MRFPQTIWCILEGFRKSILTIECPVFEEFTRRDEESFSGKIYYDMPEKRCSLYDKCCDQNSVPNLLAPKIGSPKIRDAIEKGDLPWEE